MKYVRNNEAACKHTGDKEDERYQQGRIKEERPLDTKRVNMSYLMGAEQNGDTVMQNRQKNHKLINRQSESLEGNIEELGGGGTDVASRKVSMHDDKAFHFIFKKIITISYYQIALQFVCSLIKIKVLHLICSWASLDNSCSM